MLVLLSDGYLSFKELDDQAPLAQVQAQKFFKIARKLPLDFQMMLVRRVYLSPKGFYLSHETEAGLKRVLAHFCA